jgi:hypothetical protein
MANRDVGDVCDQILKMIPPIEHVIRKDIEDYSNSLWNVAPELRQSAVGWNPLMRILNYHVSSIDCQWKKDLIELINQS